ncbi:MAG: serine/threonine-protein kinase [Acidobacteriota bacterium]
MISFPSSPRRRETSGLEVLLVVLLIVAVVAAVLVTLHLIRQSGAAQRVTTRRLDRYEVREPIGRGGMASIYKATDTLRRGAPAVALKVMDDNHLSDLDLVHKFLREGEILMQLGQADPEAPLVRVFHFGRAGNDGRRPFIAMEYIEGEELLRHLRRAGRLSLPDAARIVAGVARALVPAHAAGVYHRDLTPDNVILTSSPRGGHFLRLIDFGVARHEYTSHGTLDGSIAGKPPYMSPEQCQGQPVDGRSDIYALGIMLFTLITGAPPFVSKNPLEVMRMHKEDEVRYPSGFPGSARLILEKALAKDRAKRQGTVVDLLADLTLLARLG